jgi:hypothetical protein
MKNDPCQNSYDHDYASHPTNPLLTQTPRTPPRGELSRNGGKREGESIEKDC